MVVAISLTPFDTLFFRDGRGFDGPSKPSSGLPSPQTLAGALKSWVLQEGAADLQQLSSAIRSGANEYEALSGLGNVGKIAASLSIRGPWLCENLIGPLQPLVRVPSDVHRVKDKDDQLIRLRLLETPPIGWAPKDRNMVPLWNPTIHRTEKINGFMTLNGVEAWCRGGTPANFDVRDVESLWAMDTRTGVSIDPETLTTVDGLIFAANHLALSPGLAFYAEIDVLGDLPRLPAVLKWGGEGRRVLVNEVTPVTWPSPSEDERKVISMTTPGVFDAGWKPSDAFPIAALVPEPDAFSGWDMARGGPKPTYFAVPPGSVYYLTEATSQAEKFSGAPEFLKQGFGCILEGDWPK